MGLVLKFWEHTGCFDLNLLSLRSVPQATSRPCVVTGWFGTQELNTFLFENDSCGQKFVLNRTNPLWLGGGADGRLSRRQPFEDGEHCHNLSRDSVDSQFLKLVRTGWSSVSCCKGWSLRPFLSSFSPCRAKPALGYVVPLLATHSESEERLDQGTLTLPQLETPQGSERSPEKAVPLTATS